MASAQLKEKVRWYLTQGFSEVEIAVLLRPMPTEEVVRLIDQVTAPTPAQKKAAKEAKEEAQRRERAQARALTAASSRPRPSEDLCVEENETPLFEVATPLAEWTYETFIRPGGALYNDEHEHLQEACIGFLWTNVADVRGDSMVAGRAELGKQRDGGIWAKKRFEYLLAQLFGVVPDFIITLYAANAAEVDDSTFCAIVEHELYHCGQAMTRDGEPRYDAEEKPIWRIVPHHVEEFVPIWRRYGPGAGAGRSVELAEAAKHPPLLTASRIGMACGSCS